MAGSTSPSSARWDRRVPVRFLVELAIIFAGEPRAETRRPIVTAAG